MSETHTNEISTRELWERLNRSSTKPYFILDVRNEDEAARWKVEGTRPVTTVNVPYFAFIDDEAAALEKVPADLGEAVVVCAKGGSSEYVASVLREAGRPAVNLTGGMIAWGDLHVPVRVPLVEEDARRFELWQFNRFGKGCLSYAVIAGDEAAIVDPSRFPEIYESFAAERGVRIVEILETHVHADHLSGGVALAQRTGARYRVLNGNGPEPRLPVPVAPLTSEDGPLRIRLGGDQGVTIAAQAIRTPGHTPGSTSYLIGDRYLLSGDTLFVQGVGRPDLGGHLEEWSRDLFTTLHSVVAQLPGETVVLPAHFSSVTEVADDGVIRGRLADLRRSSPEFEIAEPEAFVEAMRAGMKEAPAIYGQIVKANLGLIDPGDEAGEWELGRNECAVTAARRRQEAQAALH